MDPEKELLEIKTPHEHPKNPPQNTTNNQEKYQLG